MAADRQRRLGLSAARFLEEDLACRGEAVGADAVAGDAHGLDLATREQSVRLAEDGAFDLLELRPPEPAAQLLAAVADDLGDLPALFAARMDFVPQLAA